MLLECDFTKFDLFRVEFLDSVSQLQHSPFHFAAIDNDNEIFATKRLYTIPGRMLLIRRKNSNGKYQNDAITSSNLEKKLAQKAYILTLYRISYSEDLGIPDLRSISIWSGGSIGDWDLVTGGTKPVRFLRDLLGPC